MNKKHIEKKYLKRFVVPMLIAVLAFSTCPVSADSVSVDGGTNGIQVEITETIGAVVEGYGVTKTENASFSDLKTTNWAYEAVNAMVKAGYAKGYPDGTFKPNNKVSYAEFIKMMDIAVSGEDVGNSSVGHWALAYYQDAVNNGLFSKTEIGSSLLNKAIPRKDMAMIIANVSNGTPNAAYANNFSDVTASDTDILEAVTLGILGGYPDGTFKPNGTLTRAEAATVLWKFTDESKRVVPEVKTVGETRPRSEVIKSVENPYDEKELGYDLKTVTYAPANAYTWSKVEQSGAKWVYSNTAKGLSALYYLENGVITSRCKQYNNIEFDSISIFYENTPEERENAYNAEYLISVNADTKVGTIITNPMYHNI